MLSHPSTSHSLLARVFLWCIPLVTRRSRTRTRISPKWSCPITTAVTPRPDCDCILSAIAPCNAGFMFLKLKTQFGSARHTFEDTCMTASGFE